MARVMQTARKSTGGKLPRTASDPPRARGIPALATYEAPVPKVQKRRTRSEALRTRKDVSSTTEEVSPATHFNFLKLPAELRIRIYEMCVSVTEYITYDERDFCTCGPKHISQPSTTTEHTCKYVSKGHAKSKPRLPGSYYPVAPNYIGYQKWEIPRGDYARAFKTPNPPILEANRQIRNEAFPIFYSMNDFVFEDCDCFKVTHWLCNGVKTEHLKHIKSITWDGPLLWDSERPNLEDNTFVQMSSIIMLMHLKILGNCKLRLMPDDDSYEIHFACILHDKIDCLVARKGLTAAHAENEHSRVDELEVNGLIYCLAKKLSDFCHEVWQVRALIYKPAGLGGNSDWKCSCDCDELEKRDMVPWLGRKFLPDAGGST
jgi:hypothetical protein